MNTISILIFRPTKQKIISIKATSFLLLFLTGIRLGNPLEVEVVEALSFRSLCCSNDRIDLDWMREWVREYFTYPRKKKWSSQVEVEPQHARTGSRQLAQPKKNVMYDVMRLDCGLISNDKVTISDQSGRSCQDTDFENACTFSSKRLMQIQTQPIKLSTIFISQCRSWSSIVR